MCLTRYDVVNKNSLSGIVVYQTIYKFKFFKFISYIKKHNLITKNYHQRKFVFENQVKLQFKNFLFFKLTFYNDKSP